MWICFFKRVFTHHWGQRSNVYPERVDQCGAQTGLLDFTPPRPLCASYKHLSCTNCEIIDMLISVKAALTCFSHQTN